MELDSLNEGKTEEVRLNILKKQQLATFQKYENETIDLTLLGKSTKLVLKNVQKSSHLS